MTGALILTAGFEAGFQSRLEGWRRAHYPAALNVVPAHLSLFRQLPPSSEGEVRARLARLAGEAGPLPARPIGFALREGGVVLELHSARLLTLRDALAADLHGLLGHADMVQARLSVTVQNKVTAAAARACLAVLAGEVLPEDVRVERLLLWRYAGGPRSGSWQKIADHPLRGRWRG